jgi:hypothetical protein
MARLLICGALVIAAAIAASNRYSLSVQDNGLTRLDRIKGEVIYCGVNDKACVRFPTSANQIHCTAATARTTALMVPLCPRTVLCVECRQPHPRPLPVGELDTCASSSRLVRSLRQG